MIITTDGTFIAVNFFFVTFLITQTEYETYFCHFRASQTYKFPNDVNVNIKYMDNLLLLVHKR